LLPPLIISLDEIDFLLQAIDKTLSDMIQTPDGLGTNLEDNTAEILRKVK